MNPDDAEQIDVLFEACDVNQTGFIDRDEFQALCADLDLTPDEFDQIFTELDVDKDGSISKSDFREGFENVSNVFLRKKSSSPHGSPLLEHTKRIKSFSSSSEEEEEPIEEANTVNNVKPKRRIVSANSIDAWETLIAELDSGYYQLNRARYVFNTCTGSTAID